MSVNNPPTGLDPFTFNNSDQGDDETTATGWLEDVDLDWSTTTQASAGIEIVKTHINELRAGLNNTRKQMLVPDDIDIPDYSTFNLSNYYGSYTESTGGNIWRISKSDSISYSSTNGATTITVSYNIDGCYSYSSNNVIVLDLYITYPTHPVITSGNLVDAGIIKNINTGIPVSLYSLPIYKTTSTITQSSTPTVVPTSISSTSSTAKIGKIESITLISDSYPTPTISGSSGINPSSTNVNNLKILPTLGIPCILNQNSNTCSLLLAPYISWTQTDTSPTRTNNCYYKNVGPAHIRIVGHQYRDGVTKLG